MKTNSWLASTLTLISFCARGQVSLPSPASVPVIVESGLHQRVWQTLTVDEEGQTNASSFTEVATGLNFLDPATGQYLPSKELFELAADGSALAAHGQHRVRLESDINSVGSVDLAMPDGQRLISNPMGLSFFDYSSGKNILLAEVTNCIGELVAPNVVVYPSAFDTLKAALRYTYTKDGFEQDVILYENPASPADYGLNPDTTLLEMYSEFFNPPVPTVQSSSDKNQTLDFGQMQIGRGQAYFLNETLGAADVNKTWANIDGRTFLVESVPYPSARSMLEKMALAQGQASNRSTQDRKGLVAGLRPRERAIRVASIKPGGTHSKSGAVIDYVANNSNLTNFTWQGDTTYYISGNVGLFGTNTTWEAGTVIKYTNGVSLTVNTPVTWQGTPYRPIVLTARDDRSVGDAISPSNTLSGYYATVALNFAVTNTAALQNLRVAYASTAVSFSGGTGHSLSHAQLVSCQNGIAATNTDFSLRNALFDHVLTNFTGSSSTGRVEHLTADTASWLNNNIGANLYLTNCLLVAVTNTWSFSSNTVYSTSASGVFQSVGQGFHYLNTNSIYRNVGTTNINSTLAAQLKKLTTYPPLVLTSDFTVSTTLSPQAQRDTDVPDVGWHYDPLDYCWSGLNLTSATLTLTNGVAIGSYGTNGLILKNGAVLVSEGTPNNLNRLTRYHAVQEQPVLWGAKANAMLTMTGTYTPLPIVRLRFTDIPAMAFGATSPGDRSIIYEIDNLLDSLTLVDCQLRGTTLYYTPHNASYASSVLMTNNLAERSNFYVQRSSTPTPLTVNLRNNLFWRTGFYIWYDYYSGSSNPTWDIKDNLFDNCSMTEGGTNYTSYILNSYNGYVGTGVLLASSGGHDKTPSSFNYATGALGPWYQSSTNMIDQGSVTNAALAGLYHYTTQTSQIKEANTALDIGLHYVAVDGNGNPLDYDGDGLPDYFEDRNGNDVTDTGETNWRDPNDLGLKVWITEPKNNSNIP